MVPLVLTATAALILPTAQQAARNVDFHDRAPFAAVTIAQQHPGGWGIAGWAFDPDKPGARLSISVYLDKRKIARATADVARADFGRAHPVAGPNHGFLVGLSVPEGRHTVCLWANNVGAGASNRFGCVTRTFDYGPVGVLDAIGARSGLVNVQGYAYDDDSPTTALRTTVTVDGTAHSLLADLARPTQANVLHGGIEHGFAVTVPVAQGRHTVCTRVTNIGYGTDADLGCRTVVLDDSPRGDVDYLGPLAGQLRVRGWAVDPEAPTTPLQVLVAVDGAASRTLVANLSRPDLPAPATGAGTSHGFEVAITLPEGSHRVTVTAVNIGLGSPRVLIDRQVPISFAPTISVEQFSPRPIGALIKGWAADPDTSAPIPVRITVDGHLAQTLLADDAGTPASGHRWLTHVALTSGTHTVCAYAVNVRYGNYNSRSTCFTQIADLGPVGAFEKLVRAPGRLGVAGWAFDPDTAHGPITADVTMDGHVVSTLSAGLPRADIGQDFPDFGPDHGFAASFAASDGEHTVCVTARNVGGGADQPLGCKLIVAVHPVAPSAPHAVAAVAGYGRVVVSWAAPSSDGGAPPSAYLISTVPATRTVRVSGSTFSATLFPLASHTAYTVSVRAVNVGGVSLYNSAPAIVTQTAPPPQTTPAPVSTSRYIRNIRGSSAAELAIMRAEGAADARANPSGHSYLILLDIGGQYGNGVILSAGVRYVSYPDLARDIQAYADGYHSGQRPSAPVTIAIGTNNDINVSAATGRVWADAVVDPVRSHAAGYGGMAIAGANDIEPGFRAGYDATASWLSGFLGATSAQFVFNGSADGCAWTTTSRGCNNGWSMYKLYRLAAGAEPTRIVNLPQIYNTTMAAQWKYISLTGVVNHQPRIRFGGPLTEWTACNQAGSCGSMGGRAAWAALWRNLQSDSRLRTGSLPFSTDLRIDRS